jgi:hypothetical protein
VHWVPGNSRVNQVRTLAGQALTDLFDQRQPFGRLAFVQVPMLAGDTLVTISLADSLFLSISSISPHELKSRVLLYLVVTLAPFAVVCPCSGRSSTASAGPAGHRGVFGCRSADAEHHAGPGLFARPGIRWPRTWLGSGPSPRGRSPSPWVPTRFCGAWPDSSRSYWPWVCAGRVLP